MKVDQAKTWYKGKMVLFVFAVLALVMVSVPVGISLYSQSLTMSNPANLVAFTCHLSSPNQTYTINVEINLRDGFDETEAIKVAKQACDSVIKLLRPPDSCYPTAHVREDGIWEVKLDIAFRVIERISYCAGRPCVMMGTDHTRFQSVINPFNRTVMCEFV